MHRVATLFVLTSLASTALATETTVRFTGAPTVLSELGERGWEATVTLTETPTAPWTIEWRLPRTYEATPPGGDPWLMGARCSFGVGSDSLPATSVSMSPTPVAVPIGEELRRFGAGERVAGGQVRLTSSGSELFRDASVTLPVSAPPYAEPAQGTCTLFVRGIGGFSAPVIDLQIATFPVDDLLPRMLQDAETAYGSPDGLPDAARVGSDLDTLVTALVDGGCLLDAEVEDGLSGAYGTGLTGFDSGDDLLDTVLNRSNQTFGVTRYSGDRVGTPGFSRYNGAGKLFADRDDGGFVAGHWYRGAGRRGVFHTVTGTCEGGTGARAALDTWFGGGLL